MAGSKTKDTPLGLFDTLDTPTSMQDLWAQWTNCQRCSLYHDRNNVVIGSGWPGSVLCVGMAPGKDEDKDGIPFMGRPGRICREYIHTKAGIPEKQVFWTNVLGCKPPENEFGAEYRSEWVKACTHRLDSLVMLLKPKLVVAMGKRAAERFGINGVMDEIRCKTVNYKGANVMSVLIPAMLLRYSGREAQDIRAMLDTDFTTLGKFYREIMYGQK